MVVHSRITNRSVRMGELICKWLQHAGAIHQMKQNRYKAASLAQGGKRSGDWICRQGMDSGVPKKSHEFETKSG
jgi:hypothetical protein